MQNPPTKDNKYKRIISSGIVNSFRDTMANIVANGNPHPNVPTINQPFKLVIFLYI